MDTNQEIFAICGADFIGHQRCKSFALWRIGEDGVPVPWQIVILRSGGDYYGYVNRCPHQKSPLNFERDQFFDPERRYLMCGKHGATFDIATGICVEGPCRGERLEKLDVAVLDGDVCLIGVKLVEDDGSDDPDRTMDIMIHPD